MRIRGLNLTTIGRLVGQRANHDGRPLHVFLCVADHWEPKWRRPPKQVERERVARWVSDYPRLAQSVTDCRSRPPQHTFFYPAEEYESEHLGALAGLCRQGLGDVEVHLHHDGDTADNLRETLQRFTAALHNDHGLFARIPAASSSTALSTATGRSTIADRMAAGVA